MILSLRRLAAYWVDFMFLAILLVGMQFIIFHITGGFPFDRLDHGYLIEAWVLLSISLPVWLYFIGCEYYKGQTLGKRIFSLRVRSSHDHSNPTWSRVWLRTFIRLLPWELTHLIILIPEPWFSVADTPRNVHFIYLPNAMLLAYIIILFLTNGERGLHDYIARTEVIAVGEYDEQISNSQNQ